MKRLIHILLLLFITTNTFAQKDDKIKTLKVSYFTDKLDLTEKEAEKFWPIYNAYYDKILKIKRKDIRNIKNEIKEKENANQLTEEKSVELLNRLKSAIKTLHYEEAHLFVKLEKVLPTKKILLLKITEEDFKRKILEQYRNKKR